MTSNTNGRKVGVWSQPLRDPGDVWPWKAPARDPGDVFPWRPAGFAGFAENSLGWYAWLNTMPPGPNTLHVIGDVIVSNPGVRAHLTMRYPQGINPSILILDLSLIQEPGMWPAVLVSAQARFEKMLPSDFARYQMVEVYLEGVRIVSIDHIEIAG